MPVEQPGHCFLQPVVGSLLDSRTYRFSNRQRQPNEVHLLGDVRLYIHLSMVQVLRSPQSVGVVGLAAAVGDDLAAGRIADLLLEEHWLQCVHFA